MSVFVTAVFAAVYVGMLLGGIPGLRVDRTGVALLGAIVLLAGRGVTEQEALESVDVPTLALLFGLMVVSAQFELGGLYAEITNRVVAMQVGPKALLAVVVAVVGTLSAILTNDVVCLAMAPLVASTCLRKGLNPVPFLLGVACAANIGSAATIIGNPQNILIGETLELSFTDYFARALPPSLVSLLVVWAVLLLIYRGKWTGEPDLTRETVIDFDRVQSAKGIVVMAALIICFVVTPWPRELVALSAAGFLLLSRRFYSHRIVGLVDWHLIVLFVSLFVINHAFQLTGGLDALVSTIRSLGFDLHQPATLFITTAVLGNLVSNVPAVMLLLPLAEGPQAGILLALSSTFTGNLLVIGSIANIVVLKAAQQEGIEIGTWTHARVGVPVTLASLLIAGGWLWIS